MSIFHAPRRWGELLAQRAEEITGLSAGQHRSAALSFRQDKMEVKDGYGAVNAEGEVGAPLQRRNSRQAHEEEKTHPRTHSSTEGQAKQTSISHLPVREVGRLGQRYKVGTVPACQVSCSTATQLAASDANY